MTALLEIRNLNVAFGATKVVDGLDLTIDAGQVMALVGESGCGKSVTALSILRLLPPPGRVVDGAIRYGERDLVRLPEKELNDLRGGEIAVVWQDPLAALNPVLSVGTPIIEALLRHRGLGREEALKVAVELLGKVGVAQPEMRLRAYPHQLSGGQRQRIMIAAALACKPKLLIADEPTTALDVSVQAQILELLRELVRESGTSILLITHDLGVVAQVASRVAVMYAGGIVEQGSTTQIFGNAQHPYTQGLLQATPRLHSSTMPLPIPGVVPLPGRWPAGCRFKTRCPIYKQPVCDEYPALQAAGDAQPVRCWFPGTPAWKTEGV